jgi:phenylacetate-CoA ligase
MIRYRTRDITALVTEPCACGRTLRRIKRITRRTDDMIIIRGVNVYPAQIESALLRVEGTLPHYQIVLTRVKDLDEMEVEVEVTPAVLGDTMGALEQVQQKLTAGIENAIGLRARVRLVQPHTIQRSQGKAKRVIDNRKM